MNLLFISLLSSWENYTVYNGGGDLNPLASLTQIGASLLGIGFVFRGIVILRNSMKADSPSNGFQGVISLLIGIFIVTVIKLLISYNIVG